MKQSTFIILFIILVAGISILVREAFPKRVLTNNLDTLWVESPIPPLNLNDIPAHISLKKELVKANYDRSEWKKWAEIYGQMNYLLRDSLNENNYLIDSLLTIIAEIDTLLPPYGDTLNVKYKFPPINLFSIGYFPVSRPTMVIHDIVYKTPEPTFFDKLKPYAYFSLGLLSGYGLSQLQESVKK